MPMAADPPAPGGSLRDALRELANEAEGFLAFADRQAHGATNMAVMRRKIDAARAALSSSAEPAEPRHTCGEPCRACVEVINFKAASVRTDAPAPPAPSAPEALAELLTWGLQLAELNGQGDVVIAKEIVKAALQSSPPRSSSQAQGWQPIETAPKDEELEFWGEDGIDIGQWQDGQAEQFESGVVVYPCMPEGWYGCKGYWPAEKQPTHWRRPIGPSASPPPSSAPSPQETP